MVTVKKTYNGSDPIPTHIELVDEEGNQLEYFKTEEGFEEYCNKTGLKYSSLGIGEKRQDNTRVLTHVTNR
ncbi:hypothetical protein ACQUY5_16785 [Bacillus cereus]|uniref:hypothetical protein n=1 Tax=Bacillus cereus TaxID=1396 RepID=UPI003D16A5D0